MKKIVSLIAAFLLLGGIVFADVTVKELEGGNVEVTFFFASTKSNKVVIAGDWTNWKDGALPMTKTDKGWEYKTTVPMNTVMKYKFIADDAWIFDTKAPDKVDDGYGGFNGLVDVAAIVASQKAGTTVAAVAAPAGGSKISFQTWSMAGAQLKVPTVTGGDSATAGIGAKSYLKFSGNILPSVPAYAEIALFENDSFDNLYKDGSLTFKNGFTNFLVDTIFDPIYYFGGQKAAGTYLGHLKLGFDSDYVNFVTGYKYAKLPGHTNVSWTTVDSEWEAGYAETGGFSVFNLGQALRNYGDLVVNATIGPNRTADRAGSQYGLFSYVNAQYGNHYLDLQYNGAYGKTFDTIFDEIYEADFIGGYDGKFSPFEVKANVLYNVWGANIVSPDYMTPYNPSSSDVSGAKQGMGFLANFAANVQGIYTSDYYGVTLGYRARGFQANMMYVEEGADSHTHLVDQLGYLNTQRVWIDGFVYPMDALTVGLTTYAEIPLDKTAAKQHYNDKDNIQIYAKPSVEYKLDQLVDYKSSVAAYGKLYYNTAAADAFIRGTKTSQFLAEEAGLKGSVSDLSDTIKEADLYYGFDNGDEDYLFNTLLGVVKLPNDLSVQAGAGLRTANAGVTASKAPFGFFLGASTKLKVLQKPTAYVQFVYNMDPYKSFGDGQESLYLDNYVTYNGVDNYDGYAAARLGLHWDL
ncbi:MAG: glycogen-binding domain-containing protein [Spirochaetaceae bacterium]|nr:glycogen-binding domain-containing protein [Spirochaetaceae bacterium]